MTRSGAVAEATRYSLAIEDPNTRVALRRLQRRAWRAIGIGLLGLAAAFVVIGVFGDDEGNLPGALDPVVVIGGMCALIALGFGLAGLVNNLAARRTLRSHRWGLHSAKFRHVLFNNGAPALVFDDREADGAAYFLSGTRFRAREWEEFDGAVLVAGKGRRRVVARPDRSIVRVAYATRRRGLARRTVEYVDDTPPTGEASRWSF